MKKKVEQEEPARTKRSFIFNHDTLQRLRIHCAMKGGTAQDKVEAAVEAWVKRYTDPLPVKAGNKGK